MAHLLNTYLTIAEYATKKEITRKYVYLAIKDGKIVPETVGMTGELKLIDWKKYKNFEFKRNKKQ